jgi:Transcriptional regulators
MKEKMERFMIGNRLKKFVAKQLNGVSNKYGIKKTELNIFIYLSKASEKNTARDIQEYLSINKGYLSRILDELCRKGYLEGVPDQHDRRYIHYVPTELAKPMIEELRLTKSRLDDKIFSGISDEELEMLEKISCKIDRNIQNMLDNGL